MRVLAALLGLAFACGAAQATTITIELPGAEELRTSDEVYECGDGASVAASYLNAGNVALVVLSIDEETIVAANVLAASGARYAGDRYIWWTRGDEASLYDLTKGEDAPPVECHSAG